ncbi:CBO0543 family protein [Metabacillus fastidiosus]|uniref:CBO0543 family protein n=1 Tax=Metabacillus fastidiosus TaxID=1458 RepID=UPI002DB7ABDA|nr:CBO0543 family protein [Metabacillus fastidiosus]MEC2078502.1 hypothetical protein [Metabacillus fastidiosus]
MNYPSSKEIIDFQNKLTEMRNELWYYHDLFTPQWWFLLVLTILPWMIWWYLVDRTRIKKIWLYGALMTILILYLDDIGSSLGLWDYPIKLIGIFPRLNPIDVSVLPVFHMIIYQYFTKWKPFLIGNIIAAVIFAYAAEPFFVKIHIYQLIKWKHFYSIPGYILKAIIIKYIMETILDWNKKEHLK